MSLTLRGLTAFALAAIGVCMARMVSRRVGFVDRPGPRKPHAAPVPLGGGVGVALGLTVALARADVHPGLLPAAWALVAIGLVDDAKDLRARTRLLLQAAVALPLAVELAPTLGLGRPLEVALALLWTLGVVSAINCMDSADGVASGISVAAAISIGSLAGWEGEPGVVAAALAGASGGFLVFNTPPARVFLGESGSTLLGFLLAVLALETSSVAASENRIALCVAAATVLAVPVLDFLLVHLRRVRAGVRRPADLMASADTDHLPHRIRAAGLSPRAVAVACAGATALSGMAARVAVDAGPVGSMLALLGVTAVFFGAEALLFGLGRRRRAPGARAQEPRRAHPASVGGDQEARRVKHRMRVQVKEGET